MKIISKLFSSKKDAAKHEKKARDGSSVTTASDLSSTASSLEERKHKKKTKSSKKKKNEASKKPTSIPEVVEEYKTPNEKVVAAFLDAWNTHRYQETPSFFSSEAALIKFEDNPDMPLSLYMAEVNKVFKSFPDIQFHYESIKEDRSGLVLVDEINVTATHSGEPYAFGPFPPVPTTNKHIANDPERFWFTVKDGKIDQMEIISMGDLTGPPGLYMQIGGKMEMPPPPNTATAETSSS